MTSNTDSSVNSKYKIEWVEAFSLKKEKDNANEMTQRLRQSLRKSIVDDGLQNPLLIEQNNIIINGNHRYDELVELGWKKIPCVRIKVKNLAERKRLQIESNHLHGKDNLKTLAKNYDLLLQNNTLNDHSLLLNKPVDGMHLLIEKYQEKTIEKSPQLPDEELKIETKAGQLFQLGEHRVLCGDSLNTDDVKKLLENKKPVMLFTDPPYDLKEYGYLDDFFAYDTLELFVMNADKGHRDLIKLFGDYIIENHIIRFNSPVGYANQPMISHRILAHFRKGKSKFKNLKDAFGTVHDAILNRTGFVKHEKPIKLPKDFIVHYTEENDLILDLFAGSGSTLFAAQETKRICYTIEKEPENVDYILKQWYRKTGKKPISLKELL